MYISKFDKDKSENDYSALVKSQETILTVHVFPQRAKHVMNAMYYFRIIY